MEFRNLDQHKAFMKKEAARLGISVNAAYKTYLARLLLSRLAQVNYGTLVVKGSFSQYVHLKDLSRPVLDIDLSSQYHHQVPILLLFQSIYRSEDEHITFDLNRLPYQTPNGVYKLPVVARIKYPDNDKIVEVSVPIDFKENNNVIFETQFKGVEPLFEGDTKFYINTPSFEEHIAEKLYIIAHNKRTDVLNTRVKDFYDIYKLHGTNYDPDKFALYFQAMLMMYGEDLRGVDAEFLDKQFIRAHEDIWQAMQKKYEFVDKDLELDEAVYYTKAVLKEQIQKIRAGEFTDQAQALVRRKSQ